MQKGGHYRRGGMMQEEGIIEGRMMWKEGQYRSEG